MDPVVSYSKEISEDDQKLRSFMNQSSIHSFNHTLKKDRIIRITNGRIFRNGKVDCFIFSIMFRLNLETFGFVTGEFWIPRATSTVV